MVNILHFTSEDGEPIAINAQELQTKAGREYLQRRLTNQKANGVINSSDTNTNTVGVATDNEATEDKE